MESKIEDGNVYMNVLDDGVIDILKKYLGTKLDQDNICLVLDLNKQLDRDIAFSFACAVAIEKPSLATDIFMGIQIKERRNEDGK